MKPHIKFGDILKYSDEWYRASGMKPNNRRFVATGKIGGTEPDWLIYVAGKDKAYIQCYHHTFLTKVKRLGLLGQ